MNKKVFGLILLIVSILSSFSNITMTGNIIGYSAGSYLSFVSILSFILGVIMILTTEKLERIILISKQAIERSEKDARVRGDMQRYSKEIRMTSADPTHRQQEMIGEFHVSPRSKTGGGIRVAWHRKVDEEKGKEIIYIDDFLYHINKRDYVDRWNRKAARGEIKQSNYEFEES